MQFVKTYRKVYRLENYSKGWYNMVIKMWTGKIRRVYIKKSEVLR